MDATRSHTAYGRAKKNLYTLAFKCNLCFQIEQKDKILKSNTQAPYSNLKRHVDMCHPETLVNFNCSWNIMICIFKLQWKKIICILPHYFEMKLFILLFLFPHIRFSIPLTNSQTGNLEMFRNSGFELYSLSLSIKKNLRYTNIKQTHRKNLMWVKFQIKIISKLFLL